jgi:hypothetical protein
MASGRDAVRRVAEGYFDLVGASGRAAAAEAGAEPAGAGDTPATVPGGEGSWEVE